MHLLVAHDAHQVRALIPTELVEAAVGQSLRHNVWVGDDHELWNSTNERALSRFGETASASFYENMNSDLCPEDTRVEDTPIPLRKRCELSVSLGAETIFQIPGKRSQQEISAETWALASQAADKLQSLYATSAVSERLVQWAKHGRQPGWCSWPQC